MDFESSRLIIARKKRGLTQKALANLLGITPRHFNSYEVGHQTPPERVLQQIAVTLRFPVDFFMGNEVETISTDFVSFRAMSKMTAKMRDEALAAASLATMASDWIDEKFNLPTTDLPDLRGLDPETAAETLRREWGLGDKPISNLIHLLESKGIRIFSLTTEPKEIDAFCFWRKDIPFIFLNITKSSERTRFDGAHELGHLILHRHGEPHGRQAELEADRFASAFLMPRSSILANSSGLASIPSLIQKKRIWNVSLAALVHRLYSVGLITDWHYKQLFIEISQRGYRKSEPESIQAESSQLFKKIVSLLKDENKSLSHLSEDLNIALDDINSLFFGLILTSIDGSKEVSSPFKRPDLRLI